MATRFTFIDLFSGIGGFRIPLEKLGGISKGFSEIDKHSISTYKQNFHDPESHDLGDITKINGIPYVDVLVGGVPCQSWSVAGKMRGFEDPRGRLWYDTIKTTEAVKPKVFIYENVKGLFDPRNRQNLELIAENFDRIGYHVRYQLLNSYDFGLPQNRSRVFIVGFRKDMQSYFKKFNFPSPRSHTSDLSAFIRNIEGESVRKKKVDPSILFGKNIPRSRNAFQLIDEFNDFFVLCDTRNGHSTIHSWDIIETTEKEKSICMTILKNRRKKKYGEKDGNPMSLDEIKEIDSSATSTRVESLVKKRILRKIDNKYDLVNSKNSSGINGIYRVYLPSSKIFSTLTATGTRDYVATKYLYADTIGEYKKKFIEEILLPGFYRKISDREACLIQGFPAKFIMHPKSSLAQRQFGNAVSPPVVEALMTKISETGIFDSNGNVEFRKRGNFIKGERVVSS